MRETPFQNPRGGYFTMNDRGRLVAERQHNPNNVHIGERYYGRQGPIGNPRLAMNRGMDNWKNYGGYLGGTFDQDGYGDPSSKNPWGGYQEPEYNYDGYDDDVLDPGFNTSYALGPLYFG